jgi:hypothetical protein
MTIKPARQMLHQLLRNDRRHDIRRIAHPLPSAVTQCKASAAATSLGMWASAVTESFIVRARPTIEELPPFHQLSAHPRAFTDNPPRATLRPLEVFQEVQASSHDRQTRQDRSDNRIRRPLGLAPCFHLRRSSSNRARRRSN